MSFQPGLGRFVIEDECHFVLNLAYNVLKMRNLKKVKYNITFFSILDLIDIHRCTATTFKVSNLVCMHEILARRKIDPNFMLEKYLLLGEKSSGSNVFWFLLNAVKTRPAETFRYPRFNHN